MSTEYLTTAELGGRLKYDERTIREKLMDSVLLEGEHYLRPFGHPKIPSISFLISASFKL